MIRLTTRALPATDTKPGRIRVRIRGGAPLLDVPYDYGAVDAHHAAVYRALPGATIIESEEGARGNTYLVQGMVDTDRVVTRERALEALDQPDGPDTVTVHTIDGEVIECSNALALIARDDAYIAAYVLPPARVEHGGR